MLGASKVSNNNEIVANKEKVTTPNKKHAKPPKSITAPIMLLLVKRTTTTYNQEDELIKKGASTRSSLRFLMCFETFFQKTLLGDPSLGQKHQSLYLLILVGFKRLIRVISYPIKTFTNSTFCTRPIVKFCHF
jgi:hypothetical protein